jgi:3'(2'), 5'-bisphosphate nucleotidase
MTYDKELTTALDAVKKASVLCRKVQNTIDVDAIQKADRSPVTLADFASQAVINMELRRAFPDDPMVSEEESAALRENDDLRGKVTELVREIVPSATESDIMSAIDFGDRTIDYGKRYWTLDPIDGTKGFLRGEQYAIALALVEGGVPVLGVLGCPNFQMEEGARGGWLFYAVTGRGTRARRLDADEERPVRVDDIADPKQARFCESVEKAHAAHDVHHRISAAIGIEAFPCRMDSQAKYAAVSSGDASIYLRLPRSEDYREKIWDHAAGAIVVTEAGGAVTDFSGRSLDFSKGHKLLDNYGIVASNGRLHERILAAIKKET